MSRVNDKVMVVTGIQLEAAHAHAAELLKELEAEIFNDGHTGTLLSPIALACNGIQTFTIATTGSKVGWGRAEKHAAILRELASWLDQTHETYYARWAIIDFPEVGPTKCTSWDTVKVARARLDEDGTATPKTYLSAPAGQAIRGATTHVDRETGQRTELKK